MKNIGPIEQADIWVQDDGSILYRAKFAVDVDGTGDAHGDPCYQPDTSLHQDGKPLNADIDRYVVVPPLVITSVAPVVLGCQARVTNLTNGKTSLAVVGDVGPRRKIGEGSRALALALGLDGSPTHGGTWNPCIEYVLWPGHPAIVGFKKYKLQPWRT